MIYAERLSRLPAVRVPLVPRDVYHAQYRFYAYVNLSALCTGWTRDRIVAAIAERGAPAFSGTCSEVYRERAFEGTGWAPAAPLLVAQELGETSLAFLVHPTLPESWVHEVCDVVEGVVTEATR